MDNPIGVMWDALRRRRLLATTLFAATLAAVLGLVYAMPDMYRAGATVMINPSALPESIMRGTGPAEIEPRLYAVTQEVLSRENLRGIIERHDLYADMRRTASETAVIERMRRDVHIERQRVEVGGWGQGTTIAFDVVYHGFDRETTAAVANDLAALYVTANEELRRRQAGESAALLRTQLDEVQARLESQEQALHRYREARLGELPEQQAANLSTLERLNAQLRMNSENMLRAMERRNDLLRAVEEAGGDGGLAALRRELAATRARVSDNHPDVRRLQAEIAALERDGARVGGGGTALQQRQLEQLDERIEALQREEARLRQSISVYEGRIENVPRREQELASLTRDYTATREQYSSLLERYEEALLAEGVERHADQQFRVLDPATPPELAAGPPRLRLAVMAFVFAVMLAAGGVVLAEQLDTSFHSIDELKGFSNVPVIAGIPRIVTTGDVARGWAGGAASVFGVVAVVGLLAAAGYLLGHGNTDLVLMMTRRGA